MGTVLAVTSKFPLPDRMIRCIHQFLDDSSIATTYGTGTSDIANLDDLSDDLADYWCDDFIGKDYLIRCHRCGGRFHS